MAATAMVISVLACTLVLVCPTAAAPTRRDVRPALHVRRAVQDPTTTTPDYVHHPEGCVGGHNIKLYHGKTVQECKSICDQTAGCVAFEYGVAYGGPGGYKPAQCQPQSSANKAGCSGAYYNLDLYVKQFTGKGPIRYQRDGLTASDIQQANRLYFRAISAAWSFDTACSTGSSLFQNPFYVSTCTTKHVKKHCYNQRLGTAKYASWAIAKAACAANSNCFGVYDAGCRKSSIYLCDSRKITSSAKLSNSGSSCVFEKPNAGSVVAPS